MILGGGAGGMPQGTPGGASPFPFIEVASDPSVAPGRKAPVGTRAFLATGIAAWDKVGTADTAWVPVGTGGGGGGTVSDVTSSDASVIVGAPTGPAVDLKVNLATALPPAINATNSTTGVSVQAAREDHDHGQTIEATWTLANPRIYALDATAGNDANAGFVTAASASVADVKAATAAAGLVALKTVAALSAVFPKVGAGRSVVIVVNTYNGTVTYNGLYAVIAGTTGYARGCPLIRGTSTQATASCVAFDGTPADIVYWGAAIASGTNAPGYNPTGSPTTTTIQLLKAGGGAAGLTAESAGNAPIPIGLRLRFDNSAGTTTQVALRNVCARVIQVIGTDTVVLDRALPAVPAAGDTLYFEDGGIVTDTILLQGGGFPTLQGPQIVGVRCTGALGCASSGQSYVFFSHVGSFSASRGFGFWSGSNGNTPFYVDGTFPNVGGGLRVDLGGSSTVELMSADIPGVVYAAGTFSSQDYNRCTFRAGAVAAAGLTLKNSRAQMDTSFVSLGAGTGEQPSRVIGPGTAAGVDLRWWSGTIANLQVTNMGSKPCIMLRDRCFVVFGSFFSPATVGGSSGNNDVGLDLTNSFGAIISIQGVAPPTITGVLGDIRLAGGQIISWAAAFNTGIVDSQDNRIIAPGTAPNSITKFSGPLVGAVGAQLTYFSDPGPFGASGENNQTTPCRYPTSMRLAIRLRVTNIFNNSVNATTVTLYKNGVATAMQVSIPAGSAAYTKFQDLSHPILFGDNDDYDLRGDDPAGDSAGGVNIAGALEWAA